MDKVHWADVAGSSRLLLERAKNSLHYRVNRLLNSRNQRSKTASGVRFLIAVAERADDLVKTQKAFRVRLRNDRQRSAQLFASVNHVKLKRFFAAGSVLEFPHHAHPEMSVILSVGNKAERTLNCVNSILDSRIESYEVVIVNNSSTEETSVLLTQIKGARIIQNSASIDSSACSLAGRAAAGTYLLFLSDDVRVIPESITSALETLKTRSDAGAVAGRIILPHGVLQEAGRIIWQDGTYTAYGRGESPFAPMYMYTREMDCCSQDFLLTRRDVFSESEGFDETFKSADGQAADYCIRLQKTGKRVIYNPNVVTLRHNFAGSNLREDRRERFADHDRLVEKHQDWLRLQHPAANDSILRARNASDQRKRILLIEDRVPHAYLGAGYPRSNFILKELAELGYFVTLYPLVFPIEEWASAYQDTPQEVEVMLNYRSFELGKFLQERADYYDLIFVSRPHNMATLKTSLKGLKRPKIVYDAEALFCMRRIEMARLQGAAPSPQEVQKLIHEEVKLAEGSFSITSVSQNESRSFAEYGFEKVYTLSHAIELRPTPNPFEQRQNILFVGPIRGFESPNADAVTWFVREVLPIVQAQSGQPLKLIVAGPYEDHLVKDLVGDRVEFIGRVEDLTDSYNNARLFIAPMRFSAGIPLKIYEAAAHGLPVVATSLAATQLSWQDETELLVASDAEAFATACIRLYQDPALWSALRGKALDRVGIDCSPEAFSAQLKYVVEEAMNA